jgi:superfamily II DNA or RNA helicase
MTVSLRDYQSANIDEIRQLQLGGEKSVLWQLPTGGGKTAGATYMAGRAAQRGRRVWFVCHRKELLRQSSEAFTDAGIRHGFVAADALYDRRLPVHICGIDTLRRRLDRVAEPDLIIWDECHHMAAASWSAVFSRFPKARHVGLSATPERLDGKGLGEFFGAMVLGPSTADLIERGYLSPYRLFAPATQIDLSGVHMQAGDYNRKELSAVMSKPSIVGDAVNHYLQRAAGRSTLLFAHSVEFSEQMAARFRDAGIPAVHVDAKTDGAFRYQAIKDLENGHLKVLCNVDLFGEGVSVNNVACVIQMRPTQSLSLHLQQIGRGLRMSPGKSDCIILDPCGNSGRHGLPDDPREWSLLGRQGARKKSDGGDACRQCPACYAISPAAASKCRDCGKPFPIKAREIEEVAGQLSEVEVARAKRQAAKDQAAAETLEDLIRLGQARNMKNPAGWARHVIQARQAKGRV